MNDIVYERIGIGEDWYTHHWFCEVLQNAKVQLANKQLEDAEHTVAFASLFALERMNPNALAASLTVLGEILEARGVTLKEYLKRGEAA